MTDTWLISLGTQAKRLLAEYDIEASESREKNLNRFMQFVGVSYQMVSWEALRRPVPRTFADLVEHDPPQGLCFIFTRLFQPYSYFKSMSTYQAITYLPSHLGSLSSQLCWRLNCQWLLD